MPMSMATPKRRSTFSSSFIVTMLLLISFLNLVSVEASLVVPPPSSFACCSASTANRFSPGTFSALNWADMTMEFWIGIGDYPTAYTGSLVEKVSSSGLPYPISLFWDSVAFTMEARVSNGQVVNGLQAYPFQSYPNNLTWHHFAVVRDSVTKTLGVYIDGGSPIFTTARTELEFEQDNTGLLEMCFNGVMTEIRIWSVALNPTEIATRWNTRLTGTEQNLYDYWPLTTDLSSGKIPAGIDLTPQAGATSGFFSGSIECDNIISNLMQPTPSLSTSASPSVSISASPNPSATRTTTRSPSRSLSRTRSRTPSISRSAKSPSRTVSRTPTRTVSPSFNPCTTCYFPIGNDRVRLESGLVFSCPVASRTSSGTLVINTDGLETLNIPVTFTVTCPSSNTPEISVSFSFISVSYSFGSVTSDAVRGNLQYDSTNGWTGSLNFRVNSIAVLSVTPTFSGAVQISNSLGLSGSLTGSFPFVGDSSSTGFNSVTGTLPISVAIAAPSCPTLRSEESSIQGKWTADSPTDAGVDFTGIISSLSCDGLIEITATATYALPGSEGAYEFEVTLDASYDPATNSWSGEASGDSEIASVPTTLSAPFGETITSRRLTAELTLGTSTGQGLIVAGRLEYPSECDPDFPLAVGTGSLGITAFPFGLPPVFTLEDPIVTVLMSCDGSGYWGFTANLAELGSFSAAGLTISLSESLGVVVDFGCPPVLPGWGEYGVVKVDVLGGSRRLLLPNTRASECEEGDIQATVFGGWKKLMLMASFNFNSNQMAVRAVAEDLPSINDVINAIVDSGGIDLSTSDLSSNSIVVDFAKDIISNTNIEEVSVLFDLPGQVLTTDLTIRLWGVPVQGLVIYQVRENIYAIGVAIATDADFSGVIGGLVGDAISSLGLVDGAVAITNGPIDFALPGSETEVSFVTKGCVVTANVILQNEALKSVPGFNEIFASLGQYLPGAPESPLNVYVKLEGAPSTVNVFVQFSDAEVALTSDRQWLLTSTSFFFQTTATGFSVGIQCDIRLTIPDDEPFVVNFLGLFFFELESQTLNLEAGATSDQLWQPSNEVEIYVAFPWAITMGINIYTGPVSIGFTGSLQFGSALGTATVFIDLLEVVNSGFAFSLGGFRLRDFLAVFHVTVANGTTAATLLESFSIEKLDVSYSLVGYSSPSELITIPAGFYLDAENCNFFNFIKIIHLRAAVIPTAGFTFDGAIEKTNFGPLAFAHPNDPDLGPQLEMEMIPTRQRMELTGKITILNTFVVQGSGLVDIQQGRYMSSLYFTFGESCPSSPAVNATFDLTSEYSPSWSNPRGMFAFGVLFQADFEQAVKCLIIEGTAFLVDSVQTAIDAARETLRFASDRLAEAEDILKRESDRLSQPTQAERDLWEAEEDVKNIERRCKKFKCKWYRPDQCAAKAACKATLTAAKAVLRGLRDTVNAAQQVTSEILKGLSNAAASARRDFQEADKELMTLLKDVDRIPGLTEGLSGDLEAFADAALRIRMVQVNGSADVGTTPQASFTLIADLEIFERRVNFKAEASLEVRPILDKFLERVKDDFKERTSKFGIDIDLKVQRRRSDISRFSTRDETTSLRDPTTGELTLDTFSQSSETLNYNALNWYEPLPALEGEVPWEEICSGGYSKLFRIDLSENNLIGGIDSCIFTSQVPSLEILSVRENNMTGPIEFPSSSSFLPKLTSLSLAKNNFTQELTTASGITSFVNLKSLDLSENQFRGSLRLFSSFQKLESLNIDSNQFDDQPGYGIGNLLLDLPNLRTVYYSDNKKLSKKVKYQPSPFKLHGHIQVAFDYDYFCKEVELGKRWENCLHDHFHNKELVKDFEKAISKWIQRRWEDESSSSPLSVIDPTKGETSIKTILPMKTRFYGKNANQEGGSHTLLSFTYTYPNPNPTGSQLSEKQTGTQKKEQEAVPKFLRRMARLLEEEMEVLNFTTQWATLDYSEFSSRRSDLTTTDIPLPRVSSSYEIKTRKAVLGCPAGWIGEDCQYFCESGWTSSERFTNRIGYEIAQNHSQLSWNVLESAGALPSCVLPSSLCDSKKCNQAVYDVSKLCGRWILDECGSSNTFPGTKDRDEDEENNYEKCVEALAEADQQCSKESYECSGSVVNRYQDLIDEFSRKKKNECPEEKEKEKKKKKPNNDNDDEEEEKEEDNNGDNNEDDIAGWMIALIVIACVFGAVVITLAAVLALVFARK